MADKKLLRKIAPIIMSAAVAMTSSPVGVMAEDFTSGEAAVEVSEETAYGSDEISDDYDESSEADDSADFGTDTEDGFESGEAAEEESGFEDGETGDTEDAFLADTEGETNNEAGAVKTVEDGQIVLMNIPYEAFYRSELKNNDVKVDAFTSATKNKVRTGSLAGGSYHVDASGDEITGVTFPVKVPAGTDLSKYTQITDDSKVSITVTNRGQESTTDYTGKDALFESASYSYYTLSEKPSYYKELTVNEDGTFSFGATQGTATAITEGVTAELLTESRYGDYQLKLAGLTDTIPSGTAIYGVIVSTKEGSDYGMRHLENIWHGSKLAWGTGYTTEVHGCPVSSAHYKSIMGKTIDSVTYYTDKGMIIFDVPDVKVQTTTGIKATVADIMNTDSSAAVTFDQALPADFKAQYTVDKTVVSCTDGKLAVGALALGTHKVEIADASGKYAAIVTEFTVNTDKMPASYDSNETKLVAAKGITAEEFSAYIKSISKVKVDDTEYAATGRGSKVIVKEDGTLDLTDIQVTDATVFEITAVGYKNNLTFTYKEAENTFELNTSSKTLYTKGSTKTTLKVTTNLTDKITWKSSNTKVASVNSKGVVTAKAKGTAVITASCGEYQVTCKITVKNPSLKLSKSSATVKVGKTTKISAKATPSGKVTYKSSNSKIATVSSKGVVKGKKKGTAKITVTCNGVKKVFTVKVK